MRTTTIKFFNILLWATGFFMTIQFVSGCQFSRPPTGYYPISQWIRWQGRILPEQESITSSSGIIKIAIKPGSSQPSRISWESFNIAEGAVKLMGRNCEILLENENRYTLTVHDVGVYTGVLQSAGVRFLITAKNAPDDTQRFAFSRKKTTNPTTPDNHKELMLFDAYELQDLGIYLNLYSTASNGWRCIEIPYFVSEDFQGNLGETVLYSNWYDWGAW